LILDDPLPLLDPLVDPRLVETQVQDPDNSIVRYTLRNYGHWSRVESVNAVIDPRHLRTRDGRNFTAADREYMRQFLGAIQEDEAGHLVAATLGGTSDRYNLAPQHRTLNRNVNEGNNPHILSAWFPEENKIRRFLNDHPTGHVEWRVQAEYANEEQGRPISFRFESIYFIDNVHVNGNDFDTIGNIRNENPRQGV
jgi:hypothetical protein